MFSETRGRRQHQSVADPHELTSLVQKPHVPVLISGEGVNFYAALPGDVFLGVKFSVLELRDRPILVPDPKRAVIRFKQRRHATAAHLRRIFLVENCKLGAIETRQSAVITESKDNHHAFEPRT